MFSYLGSVITHCYKSMPEENKPAPSGSLFNFSLSDIFGAGKGIEKLAATVGVGAGRVADGVAEVTNVKWLDKARADNEAYRVQVVGDAQTHVMENRARAVAALAREGQHLQSMSITEGGIVAQLASTSLETRDLHERTLRRMMYENAMQQLNRETAVGYAAAELIGEEQVSDTPVDPDWLTRYFRTVQDISRKDAQLIYGKILAGEIKQPGTFSARTIDFLATLTQYEGQQFRELCTFCLLRDNTTPQVVLFDTKAQEKGHNITTLNFSALTHLQNIGLINFSTGIAPGYIIRQPNAIFTYGETLINIEARANADKEQLIIDSGLVLLTATGQELASVCQPAADPRILEYLTSRWVQKGHKVTCSSLVERPAPSSANNES